MTGLKDYCLTCGNGPLFPDGMHSCSENPVIAHLKASIAELEGRLIVARKGGGLRAWMDKHNAIQAQLVEWANPCVWTIDRHVSGHYIQAMAGCATLEDRIFTPRDGLLFRFCPGCGHPVEVKEAK